MCQPSQTVSSGGFRTHLRQALGSNCFRRALIVQQDRAGIDSARPMQFPCITERPLRFTVSGVTRFESLGER